jgi:ATP-dependent DNA ligase
MLSPPVEPMEALAVDALPIGDEWQYEPKWDGFRCLVFRNGADVYLQSKSKPLARYFPEIVEAVRALRCDQFVLDGELVIERDGVLSFDDLLLRLHPAASRVQRLAAETPATYLAFDLLDDGEALHDDPLAVRRDRLEALAARCFTTSSLRLSPATRDPDEADTWLRGARGGLDGLMAKHVDAPYTAGERIAMRKVKPVHTADCVVGGFRYASGSRRIGSLLLGLYDADGVLHYVGFTSTFGSLDITGLTREFERLAADNPFVGRSPGGPSRWNGGRSTEWQPVRPVRVVEVSFDHASGGRMRHGARFVRWRPDKSPAACHVDQLNGTKVALPRTPPPVVSP